LNLLRAALSQTAATLDDPALFPQVGEVIFCSELFGEARRSSIVDGKLVASGDDRCLARKLPFEPYDSARFPLLSPIFYFQGENDPAVPIRKARHHYDNQKLTSRAFVTVPGGGHGPMSINLQSLGCTPALWHAIDRLDALAFSTAVALCPAGLTLEGRVAGQ
jgi:fermentation-respiration switch protein FrsA (DUF1100 family)